MKRKGIADKTGSAFDVFIDLQLSVPIDGATWTLNSAQALEQKIISDAMAGNNAAAKTVLEWIADRDRARGIRARSLPQVFIADNDPINVDAAMLALGIASQDKSRMREGGGAYLQLEPWVAERCVKRTRNSTIKDDDLLRSSTRQVTDGWST